MKKSSLSTMNRSCLFFVALFLTPSLLVAAFAEPIFHDSNRFEHDDWRFDMFSFAQQKWKCIDGNESLKRKIYKDEYETTEMFQKRKAQYLEENLKDCSKFQEPLKVTKYHNFDLKYDADKELFSFYFRLKGSRASYILTKMFARNIERSIVLQPEVTLKQGEYRVTLDDKYFDGFEEKRFRMSQFHLKSSLGKARSLKTIEKKLSLYFVGNYIGTERFYDSSLSHCYQGTDERRRKCMNIIGTFEVSGLLIKHEEDIIASVEII